MAAVDAILGKWEMFSSDNYDEYLKAVGVGAIKRKLASGAKPTLVYTVDGNKIKQRTETALKSFEIIFESGVEFDEMTADDRKSKSTVTVAGNKLTHVMKSGDHSATTVREFNGTEMISTFTAGSVVAVRKFKRV